MLPQDFVTWNHKLCASFCVQTREKNIYICINTCFLQTNFDLLPQIFAVHVCKTICASFASFFNMASFPRLCVICVYVYTFRYAWAPTKKEQEMEFFWQNPLGNPHWKMNVFNTWSIFGVCGIRFKNRKYIYIEQRTNEKKNLFWNTMLCDKRKIVLLNLFRNCSYFFFLSRVSIPLFPFLVVIVVIVVRLQWHG